MSKKSENRKDSKELLKALTEHIKEPKKILTLLTERLKTTPKPVLIGAGAIVAALTMILAIRKKLKSGGVIRSKPKGPLAGIKILDLTVVVAGPWGTRQLSDLGAEVIKIETLQLPDSSRAAGSAPARGMAGMFCVANHGKQSIIIDIKKKEGMEVFMRMAQEVDVIVQNFRPGAVDRLGIGYEHVKKVNPDIIYLSSSGFGPNGPRSGDRIYDPIIQAVSGIGTVQGDPPRMVMNAIFDKSTALCSAQAIIAALIARDQGAGGQHINVAMIDVALQFLWPDTYCNHIWPGQDQSPSPIDILIQKTASKQRILSADEGVKDFSWVTGKHILFGKFRSLKYPCMFSGTKLSSRPAAAMMGEHTAKILKELGFSKTKVQTMLDNKSVVSTKSLLLSMGGAKAKSAKIFSILEAFQEGSTGFKKTKKQQNDPVSGKKVSHKNGPLSGLKVLDASNLIAGPMACCILADQGAEVIKVEFKGSLDPAREYGPSPNDCMGSMFMALNRNKRSILIDALDENGKKILKKLIQHVDIIITDTTVENALNISYNTVRQFNQGAIYMLIDKNQGELDVQALSGLCDGQVDNYNQPTYTRTMVCEKATAQFVAVAVSAAYFARERERGGQSITIDMLDAMKYYAMVDIYVNDIWENPAISSILSFSALYTLFLFTSKDGLTVYTLTISNKEVKGFCDAFPENIAPYKEHLEGKWKELPGRIDDLEAFADMLRTIAKKHTLDEYIARCEHNSVPCSRMYTLDEALSDAQIKHNKSICTMEHPSLGQHYVTSPAPKFFKTPATLRSSAPIPGEHTDEILAEIGYSLNE